MSRRGSGSGSGSSVVIKHPSVPNVVWWTAAATPSGGGSRQLGELEVTNHHCTFRGRQASLQVRSCLYRYLSKRNKGGMHCPCTPWKITACDLKA